MVHDQLVKTKPSYVTVRLCLAFPNTATFIKSVVVQIAQGFSKILPKAAAEAEIAAESS